MADATTNNGSMSAEGRMTVMPDYYLPKEKKRLSLTAWLAIFCAVIIVAVVAVFLLLYSGSNSGTPVVTTQTPPDTTSQPTTPEAPAAPQQPTPAAPQTPADNNTVTLPAVAIGQYSKDVDTDQDGLTDVEERLFLTSPAVPDTDQDGFIDGVEVKNLYDPATPKALLEVSPQVKTVRNDTYGYQLLIPVTWTSTKVTPKGDQFQIKPDQGTESFNITIYDNTDRLPVTDWYQKYANHADLTKFVDFKNEGGWSGIQSTDHTLVIASYGDNQPGANAFIFVGTYDPGQETVLRYPTVWDMMVNSLAVAPAATPSDTTTTP